MAGGGRGSAPRETARRLVAAGDKVYTTLAYVAPLTIINAATGEIERVCEGTEGTDEILHSDGIVAICVRAVTSDLDERRSGKSLPDTLIALDSATGDRLWEARPGKVSPMSMGASNGCLIFISEKKLTCLSLKTGKEIWNTPGKFSGTPVLYNHLAFMRSRGDLEAYSLSDGERLWKMKALDGSGSVRSDLFVAGGLVWSGGITQGLIEDASTYWDQPFDKARSPQTGAVMVGRDPATGEACKQIEIPNLLTPGHHFRCYPSKATDRFIMWPKRGIEFVDLKGDEHMRHDWVRGICKYGVMPCNGLIYAPPNQCFCYQGVNLQGFNALAPRGIANSELRIANSSRLEKGPALGGIGNRKSKNGRSEWSTFRHDPRRSGSTADKVPTRLKSLWETKLGGRLTQAVATGGTLLVAQTDAHKVCALDAQTGKALWTFTAGGRIDSPPTLHQGVALFGSADGWVYCVRVSDGALAWRYRAAPGFRRIVAFGQLESAWPVHGSVLVKDDVAYVTAGRSSSYLDGGIRVCALDPKTGELLREMTIDGPHPDLKKDIGKPFSMDGAQSDVLVTDGTYLYLGQVALDCKLNEVDLERPTNMGDKMFGRHVFSTAGFLNDDWFNRGFCLHAERWPGFYMGQQAPKSGQILVFDEEKTYGVKCYTKRNVHSPMFFPATDGYLFYADDNDNEPFVKPENGKSKAIKWLPHQHSKEHLQLDYKSVDMDKGTGMTRTQAPKWMQWLPVRGRAMVATTDALFIAGTPDELDPQDPLAAFEGRRGGVLCALSKSDGTTLSEYKLDSPPVFDGMIAASGRLFLSTVDGRVLCYGKNR